MLLVYGGGSIKRNGAYDDVTAALREAGNEVIELSGVTPNPRLDKVFEGVNLVREHGVNLILAVGGGSVIDCAKFISLGSGLGEDEDLWYDYVETGKPAPRKPCAARRGADHRRHRLRDGRRGCAHQLGPQPQARLHILPADAEVLGTRPGLSAHPAG